MREPQPGAQVGVNLRLVKPLGRGGMGSVWIADHLTLDTRVAVKFMHPEVARRDPAVLERFRREARLAARIVSPHVVAVKDYGVTEDETPYIVMELLQGRSLADHLRTIGPLSLRLTRILVSQVADVLSAAHALGVVHRDIKPNNIYLVESSYELFVKVLDFGVARIERDNLDALTETGALVGTAEYMSPEQVDGDKVDHRADLWALAVVAYQAMSGELPFKGKTLGAVCAAILRGDFEPITALDADLPASLDAWFRRAFRRARDDRFPSARDMAEALADLATSTGASARVLPKPPAHEPQGEPVPPPDASARDATLPSQGAAVPASLSGSATPLPPHSSARPLRAISIAVGVAAIGAVGLGLVRWLALATEGPAAAAGSAATQQEHTASPATVEPAPLAGRGPSAEGPAEPPRPPETSARSSVAPPATIRPPVVRGSQRATSAGTAAATASAAAPLATGAGPIILETQR